MISLPARTATTARSGSGIWSVDADDAWSDTFLSALRAYPQLPADANVEAWLVTIAHRKAIDIVRKAGRSAVPVAEVPVEAVGTGPDGRDVDLAGSLAKLPERQRFAVTYHYLAGLPYAEVATIIGGSVEAVRRAAADGVASLRKAQGTKTQGSVRDHDNSRP